MSHDAERPLIKSDGDHGQTESVFTSAVNSDALPSPDDKRKLLNDHDLRVLVEQNVEIRHQEVMSISLMGAAAAAVIALVSGTSVPSPEQLHNISPANFDIIMSNSHFGWRFLWGVPAIGFLLFIIAKSLAKVRRDSASRISIVYGHLARRNGLTIADFVTIQSFKVRASSRKKPSQHEVAFIDRDYLSAWAMTIGIILMLGPYVYVFFSILPIWR